MITGKLDPVHVELFELSQDIVSHSAIGVEHSADITILVVVDALNENAIPNSETRTDPHWIQPRAPVENHRVIYRIGTKMLVRDQSRWEIARVAASDVVDLQSWSDIGGHGVAVLADTAVSWWRLVVAELFSHRCFNGSFLVLVYGHNCNLGATRS